jgi:hypothetical protein
MANASCAFFSLMRQTSNKSSTPRLHVFQDNLATTV